MKNKNIKSVKKIRIIHVTAKKGVIKKDLISGDEKVHT